MSALFQNCWGWMVNTTVEIDFNYSSYDCCYLYAKNFDLPVIVIASGGPTLSCLNKNCPDNWDKKDTTGRRTQTPIGGIISINFCPDGIEAFEMKFGRKELSLIETVDNATKN